jgi:hypothetical protein
MTTMSELVNMIFSLCLLVGVIMDSVGAFRTWSGAPAPSFDRQRLQGIRTLAVDEFHRELSSLLVKRPQTWDHAPKVSMFQSCNLHFCFVSRYRYLFISYSSESALSAGPHDLRAAQLPPLLRQHPGQRKVVMMLRHLATRALSV